MIQITCKGNSAICTRTERLTSGMVGLQCEFIFDEAWDGLAKTAVFMAGIEKRDVLLTGAICTVPWEVLQHPGYQLVIGVYGSNADGTLTIPTVYAMCGSIAPGADPSGDESTDPTLPVWGQMQGQIGNLADLATTSKDNLVAAINEAAQSGGGGGSAVELDTTLSEAGKAADAKAVGDALAGKQPKGDYLTQNELPDMTAYRTAEAQDLIDAGKQDTLIQSGATVGQIAKITAVDDTGKPTAWEAVDMPSGESGEVKAWEEFMRFTVDNNETTVFDFSSNGAETLESKMVKEVYIYSPQCVSGLAGTADAIGTVTVNGRVSVSGLDVFARKSLGSLKLWLCAKVDSLDLWYFGRDTDVGLCGGGLNVVWSTVRESNGLLSETVSAKNAYRRINTYENGIPMPSGPVDYIKTVMVSLSEPSAAGVEFIVYVR